MTSGSSPRADTGSGSPVVANVRGDVTDAERSYAAEKIGRLRSLAAGPVLYLRVQLAVEPDPARERPAIAKAEFDVNGRLVRATVTATTVVEAVDLLEARLRLRLERHARREAALRERARDTNHWHHGDPHSPRPSYFPRPVDERELVRHKTFAMTPMSLDEAVFDLELLDLDFYLFQTLGGADAVVHRAPETGYQVIAADPSSVLEACAADVSASPVGPAEMSQDDAAELLDLGDEPFVYFLDADSGRWRVLYRRYDGHYGLIVPADDGI